MYKKQDVLFKHIPTSFMFYCVFKVKLKKKYIEKIVK